MTRSIVPLAMVLGTIFSTPARAFDLNPVHLVKKVAEIAAAPITKPIEVAIKVAKGEKPSTTDVIAAVDPTVAVMSKAAENGVPGAHEAQILTTAPITVPLDVVATVHNARERTEELQQTIANANAAEESIRQAADATKDALKETTVTIKDADALLLKGTQIIDHALALLERLDTKSAEGAALLREVTTLIQTGEHLIEMSSTYRAAPRTSSSSTARAQQAPTPAT